MYLFLIYFNVSDYQYRWIHRHSRTRIAPLNLKLPHSGEMWFIMQIYSPTEQATSTEIDSFYLQLTETIKSHTCSNLIVMGDFNAWTGCRVDGEDIVLGPYSIGKSSRNDENLIHLESTRIIWKYWTVIIKIVQATGGHGCIQMVVIKMKLVTFFRTEVQLFKNVEL